MTRNFEKKNLVFGNTPAIDEEWSLCRVAHAGERRSDDGEHARHGTRGPDGAGRVPAP